jgi:hypothetical protein
VGRSKAAISRTVADKTSNAPINKDLTSKAEGRNRADNKTGRSSGHHKTEVGSRAEGRNKGLIMEEKINNELIIKTSGFITWRFYFCNITF